MKLYTISEQGTLDTLIVIGNNVNSYGTNPSGNAYAAQRKAAARLCGGGQSQVRSSQD